MITRPDSTGPTRILLIGLGGLGSTILELLVREPGLEIAVVSRTASALEARCNLACLGAVAQGLSPRLQWAPVDLWREDSLANTVERFQPDIVMTTATMMPWWLPQKLPQPLAGRLLSAGFGSWLPVHLPLTLRVMRQLQGCGFRGQVLTAPLPDIINPVLKSLGLTPTCGIGNVDELVAKVRWLAARRLETDPESVTVYVVGHHALLSAAFSEVGDPPPYFVRIEHQGQDVTERIDARRLLLAQFPTTGGEATHFLTASCALELIRGLRSTQPQLLHVPGPLGLPGGYPVIVSNEGLRLAWIEDLSLEQAVQINERSHRFDGVESIGSTGQVTFEPGSAQILREELGFDCPVLKPEEADEQGRELYRCFQRRAVQEGLDPAYFPDTGG